MLTGKEMKGDKEISIVRMSSSAAPGRASMIPLPHEMVTLSNCSVLAFPHW